MEKQDMISVGIFDKATCGFKVQLRWTAQKQRIANLMLEDSDVDGTDELKACADHTLRIKLQSYVKDLAYEMTDNKKPGTKGGGLDYRSVIENLTPEQVESIKDKCVDWQYGTTYVADKEQKKVETLGKELKGLKESNPEKLLAMLKQLGLVENNVEGPEA